MDQLAVRQRRTLRGKALRNRPISGASARIYDRSGVLLYTEGSTTREDGSFLRHPAVAGILQGGNC